MNITKHAAGIALFTFIVGVSVFINSILNAPTLTIPSVPLSAQPLRSVAVSEPVSYEVQLVSLDFINQQSYTRLKLKRETNDAWPRKLWVYTSFFLPASPHKSWWTEPVEVSVHPTSGDEMSLTVASDCSWCAGSNFAPRSGYYALVSVSAVSAEAAILNNQQMNTDIETAIPVLVQVEPKARP